MSRDSRPLSGLLVLDFSQYIAGPLAAMLLGDLGADVVKVERPSGDAYRAYDPVTPGQSRAFATFNRGKRSVVCDLRSPGGRRLARELISSADAVVHNFLPRRAEEFGLDAAAVAQVNDRAVLCAVSAFGSAGPEASRPGYDLIAQAVSGLLALAARPGQEVPERLGGIPLSDFTTGLLAATSVLAGLLERERRGTDGGPRPADFEVSLLGASLLLQAQQLAATAGGEEPLTPALFAEASEQRAAVARLDPYYRCYRAADAFLAVACLDVGQRRRLLGVLGLDDPFAENPQRPPRDEPERTARLDLVREMEARFLAEGAGAWSRRLSRAGVPAGEVRGLGSAASSRQASENGLVLPLQQPGIGPVLLVGGVMKRAGVPLVAGGPAPGLGEHQDLFEEQAAAEPSTGAGRPAAFFDGAAE